MPQPACRSARIRIHLASMGRGRSSIGRATVQRARGASTRSKPRVLRSDAIRAMEFQILGPLEALAEGRRVSLHAAKPRALLAILLLHASEPVSSDRLIDDLWAGRPPATASKILQTYVSQLRKVLGDGTIVTGPAGYELRIEPDGLDVHRFEQLVIEARAAEPAVAADRLRAGPRALAGARARRLRPRAVGADRDRPARGAPPRRAPGPRRRGPHSRACRRARCRARGARH